MIFICTYLIIEQLGNTNKKFFFIFDFCFFSYRGLCYITCDFTVAPLWDPSLWVGGGVSGAESLVESSQTSGMEWHPKLTEIEFAPFVFQV